MCRKPENAELRIRWGCDADTEVPWRKAPVCWTCDGDDPQCATCAGSGHAPMLRCPHSQRDTWACRVVAAYGFAQVGVMPIDGGTEQQAAVFMAALGYVAGVKSGLRGEADG